MVGLSSNCRFCDNLILIARRCSALPRGSGKCLTMTDSFTEKEWFHEIEFDPSVQLFSLTSILHNLDDARIYRNEIVVSSD